VKDERTYALTALGIEIAHALLSQSTKALETLGRSLLTRLPEIQVSSIRIYLLNDKEDALTEECTITQGAFIEGEDHIPLYQLPLELTQRLKPIQTEQTGSILIHVPLSYNRKLIGMIGIETPNALSGDYLDSLSHLGFAVSIGLYNLLQRRQARTEKSLFNAVMEISRNLQAADNGEELLQVFCRLVLQYFPFDRISIFLHPPSGGGFAEAFCMNSSFQIQAIEPPAIPFPDITAPLQEKDIYGYWVPMMLKDSRKGYIVLDNIYTLTEPSHAAVRVLAELCGLLAITLENIRLFQNVKVHAQYDDLTGVYNRRMGMTCIDQLIDAAQGPQDAFVLCYMDLNGMKTVNDTLGHAAGDAMLLKFIEILKGQVRKKDILCRLGGDEFLLLFPDCGLTEAEKVWDRIAWKVEEVNTAQVLPFELSVSHGMAVFDPEAPMSAAQLITWADQRMYEEKMRLKGFRQSSSV